MISRRLLTFGLGNLLVSGLGGLGSALLHAAEARSRYGDTTSGSSESGKGPRKRVLYVAPDGQNRDDPGRGTLKTPFATLPAAYARATAGDTIILRGGTYGFADASSGWLLAGRGGMPGNPIRIVNHPGENPIIDGRAMRPSAGAHQAWASPKTAGGFPLVFWNASHVEVRGLTVRNGPMGGIHVNGTHHGFVVERCIVHDNGWLNDEHGVGLGIYGAGNDNVVRNCDAYGNHGGGEGATGRNADGFQVVLCESIGTLIVGNRAWRNSDDGFDFFNTLPPDDGRSVLHYLVDGNWAFENGYLGDGSVNASDKGDGVGFKLGGRRPGSRALHGGHTVTRCLAWGNKTSGFDDNGYNGGTEPHLIYNNVSFNNGRNTNRAFGDHGFSFIFQDHPDTILCNNVAFATDGRNEIRIRLAMQSHNVRNGRPWNAFSPAIDLGEADFASLDDTVARGPRGPDGALPHSGFLRPGKGSCLIRRGTTAKLPATIIYSGSVPDLGAFQVA